MSAYLPFNERKATEAAAYLLKLRGGRMSYMKLIKLLYLADREALLRWGRPISTDRYVSMDRGPVLSHVFNLVADETAPNTQSLWAQVISAPEHYQVHLNIEIEPQELSDAEIELLDEIFVQYGKMNRWRLVDFVHRLPEWTDPEGSAIPISYRDILRAGGKTEAEVAAIEAEIAELAAADFLQPASR
jgi:uncharacterized phage-associated protein